MLRNYLTIAVRNLSKNKGLTAINILGLAIGMVCVILIGLFIRYEFSYDRHHVNADRIYHVFRIIKMENATDANPRTSGALAMHLKQDFPEVERAARTWTNDVWMRVQGQETFFQQRLCVADPDVLSMFTIPFVLGNPETAFNNPGSLVLTQSMAQKHFGQDDPIGKILTVNHNDLEGTYHVTGVVRDFPKNATFQFDCLSATPQGNLVASWDTWRSTGPYRPVDTFVMVTRDADPQALEQKLPDFIARYMGDDMREQLQYCLHPLTRKHLYTGEDLGQYYVGYGDIKQVYAFGLVALFILLLACVNFMNLSTARSAKRAREVGLRKVVGALREQLIGQFLAEAVLMAMLALMIAVALVELILPAFNAFVNRDLVFHSPENLWWLTGLIGLGIGVGILSGSYPAFVLSSFAPTQVLKGDWTPGSKRAWLRQGLVIFQFACSIAFIAGTLVVQQQLAYIRNKDLGFDKGHIVNLPIFLHSWRIHQGSQQDIRRRSGVVKRAFLEHPNVEKATVTRFPQGGHIATSDFVAEGREGDWLMGEFDADADYLDFFGIELIAGRIPSFQDFMVPSIRQPDGSLRPDMEALRALQEKGSPLLLNEAAVRQLGWEDPLGKRLDAKRPQGVLRGYVAGVVKDFHMQTLHHQIRPVIFRVNGGLYTIRLLYLKLGPGDLPETLAFIAETWKRFLPEIPFEYQFLDEDLTRVRYENEIRTGKTLTVFSALTIFVACLGLFGLIAYRAEQKTKEIGIRKIMGASVGNIVVLLSREFMALVGIACVIACPIAFILGRRWLQNFAYRIDLDWQVFALSGALALGIALATVGYQALKAARANPVDALRYE